MRGGQRDKGDGEGKGREEEDTAQSRSMKAELPVLLSMTKARALPQRREVAMKPCASITITPIVLTVLARVEVKVKNERKGGEARGRGERERRGGEAMEERRKKLLMISILYGGLVKISGFLAASINIAGG